MFAGQGRLRIGFSEIDASLGHEPTEEQVQHAVHGCWDNPYCAFGDAVGTSLICVQGDWSNVVDAKIKGRFAALANGDAASAPYNPLYARALHVPKPWGVTAIFAEHTGNHPPLQIEWRMEERPAALVSTSSLSAGDGYRQADTASRPNHRRRLSRLPSYIRRARQACRRRHRRHSVRRDLPASGILRWHSIVLSWRRWRWPATGLTMRWRSR